MAVHFIWLGELAHLGDILKAIMTSFSSIEDNCCF